MFRKTAALLLTLLLAVSCFAAAEQEAPAETIPAEESVPSEETASEEEAPVSIERDQPFLVQITDDDPSVAYVLVILTNPVGFLPLPLEGEYTRTITQILPDGTEAVNVLHLTPEGFWMESANCKNHDCVGEGMVTLENREERILWNMVVCLPHQLVAELVTREEAKAMLGY